MNEKTAAKAKALRATIDADLETLAKAVDTVRASEIFRASLERIAKTAKAIIDDLEPATEAKEMVA